MMQTIKAEVTSVDTINGTYLKIEGVSEKYWVKLGKETLTDLEMIELLSNGKFEEAKDTTTTAPLPTSELPVQEQLPIMESKETETAPTKQLSLDTQELPRTEIFDDEFVIRDGEAPQSAIGRSIKDYDKSGLQWLIVSNKTSKRVKEIAFSIIEPLCSAEEINLLKERM